MTLGLRMALAVYRVLLRAYPRAVRRRHGQDMLECFADLGMAAIGARGWRGLVSVCVRTWIELPRSAALAWRGEGRQRSGPRPHRYSPHRSSGRSWMGDLRRDLRFAVRGLRTRPGLTLLAVVSLAIGIGANTTMISTVNDVLWSPLPVAEPDQLVRVLEHNDDGYRNTSIPNFQDVAAQRELFAGMFVHDLYTFALNRGEASLVVHGEIVSANYFEILGIQPAAGRWFAAAEHDTPAGDPVVVLSHVLWMAEFGGDRGVIGSTVRLNGHVMTVLGIAPASFNGTKFGLGMDVWVPLPVWAGLERWEAWDQERGARSWNAVGRLAAGVDRTTVQNALDVVSERLAREYPETNRRTTFHVFGMREGEIAPAAAGLPNLIALLAIGASTLVLLVACANVASLMMARGISRQREFGVRLALGAGRRRLVQQLLTESVVLAVLGGALGVAATFWTTRLLDRFLPAVPYRFAFDPAPDGRAVGVAVAVTLLSALAFGLAPAFQAARLNLVSVIKGESVVQPGRGGGRHRMFSVVIVTLVGVCYTTLVLTGLFMKSLAEIREIDPGFRVDQRMAATYDVGLAGYDGAAGAAFHRDIVDDLRRIPGVEGVALVEYIPLGDRSGSSTMYDDGRTYGLDDPGIDAIRNTVTADYFATIGTVVLRGRSFEERDGPDSPPVVIVNEVLAERLWPGEEAVGRRVRYSRERSDFVLQVIGVVANGRYEFISEDPRPAFFRPLTQVPRSSLDVIIRSAIDPAQLVPLVRSEFRRRDALVPLFNIRTLADHVTGSLWIFRMGADIGLALGILALALAAGGLYGVMAFAVGQRRQELGIRLALGATVGRVQRYVIKRGLKLAAAGIGVGMVLAVGASGILTGVLFGVQPRDPWILATVSAGLAGVCLLASWIPARTATRTDPVTSLRTEV